MYESSKMVKHKATIDSMSKKFAITETYKQDTESSDDTTMLDERNLLPEEWVQTPYLLLDEEIDPL